MPEPGAPLEPVEPPTPIPLLFAPGAVLVDGVPGVGSVEGVPMLPGVLLGELMSGVPGVGGTPGVDGLLKPEPLPGVLMPELLPGAPVPVTPKWEFTCWLHEVSIEGQLLALKVGALCSLLWSTFTENWSAPLCCTRLHGMATRLPLIELLVEPMPLLEVLPERDEALLLLVEPSPLVLELLLPGDPAADDPLNDRTTNCTWPLDGSMITS